MSASVDAPVTFNLCASFDPEGDPLWYTIDFNDPDDPTGYADAACSAQHTYHSAGIRHPGLCVDDARNPPVCVTVVLTIVEAFRASHARPVEPVDGPRPATPSPEPQAPTEPSGEVALDSQLAAPGATGQIILNGSEAYFVGAGQSRVSARGRPGTNRVEALLVDGKGEPGRWGFDLTATRLPVDGLRIVAGQTVSVSPSTVVFALSGRPGERIVFSFELPPAP
jgi:hypothetical protein